PVEVSETVHSTVVPFMILMTPVGNSVLAGAPAVSATVPANVTVVPATVAPAERLVGAEPTTIVCTSVGSLARKLVLPRNTAVIGCDPAIRALAASFKVAVPPETATA